MKTKEKILVLGADGFIGSNLAHKLSENLNIEVVAFDTFKNGKPKNLVIKDNLKIFPGNFLNRADIKEALKDIDYVFHLVSLTTPVSSMDDSLIDIETNIKATVVLLEECVKAKVERVIFSSSGGAIYGNQNKDKYKEDDLIDPISPYAISKLCIEQYLKYFKLHYGLDCLILRYSNPYGPNQNFNGSQGIIPIFINNVKNDKPITIYGDGNNIRDYIYIDDLIKITVKLYNHPNKYLVYNVGSGRIATINEVVSIIEGVLYKKAKINRASERDVDVKKIVLSLNRIKKEMGKPIYFKSIEEGIKKTTDWLNRFD